MRRIFICLAVFLCLSLPTALFADTVVTNTGRIEGKVVEETQEYLKVETAPGVVVTVNKGDVKEIIRSAAPAGEEPKPAQSDTTKAEVAKPAEPTFLFLLKDGTKIVGTVRFSSVTVTTDFGVLKVPAKDIRRIGIGKKCDKELLTKIAGLIENLGSSDFKVREQATEDLIRLGPVAASELRNAAKSSDVEIKTRAEKILASFVGREEEATPDDDVIETVKFTAVGTVEIQVFDLTTKYGAMSIRKQDVAGVCVSALNELSKVVTVSPLMGFVETKITVSAGDSIVIKASGVISYGPGGFTFTPDGGGRQMMPMTDEGFPWGTLVGRIGSSGKLFKVGSNYSGTADASGELQLKITTYNAEEFSGEYKVEIIVGSGK
jgi:hypothetical protein